MMGIGASRGKAIHCSCGQGICLAVRGLAPTLQVLHNPLGYAVGTRVPVRQGLQPVSAVGHGAGTLFLGDK